jgi:hypothetical protein
MMYKIEETTLRMLQKQRLFHMLRACSKISFECEAACGQDPDVKEITSSSGGDIPTL